jgi:peptidoglycan/LPS O-acetylase OafA/YrhL
LDVTPPDQRAPTPRRFEALEGYRGLAAAGVVVFHGFQYTREPYNGSVAHTVLHNLDTLVALFFVLSAFLLTLPWVTAAAGTSAPQSARRYVSRRAWRILPLYWVAVVAVWVTRNRHLPGDWRDLVEHLTFTQVFDSKRIFYTIGPAWSLSVEVMFYAFLLATGVGLAALARRHPRAGGPLAWFAVALGLIGVGVGWKWWEQFHVHAPLTEWAIWFGPLAKADLFGLGILLAAIVGSRRSGLTAPWPVTTLLRVAGVAVVGFAWAWRGPFPSNHEEFAQTIAGAGFVLLLAGSVLARPGSRYERALGWGPLAGLGAVSYSLYVWHEPVLLYLADHHVVLSQAAHTFVPGTLLLLAVALAVGTLSWILIERPALTLGRALERERVAGELAEAARAVRRAPTPTPAPTPAPAE